MNKYDAIRFKLPPYRDERYEWFLHAFVGLARHCLLVTRRGDEYAVRWFRKAPTPKNKRAPGEQRGFDKFTRRNIQPVGGSILSADEVRPLVEQILTDYALKARQEVRSLTTERMGFLSADMAAEILDARGRFHCVKSD